MKIYPIIEFLMYNLLILYSIKCARNIIIEKRIKARRKKLCEDNEISILITDILRDYNYSYSERKIDEIFHLCLEYKQIHKIERLTEEDTDYVIYIYRIKA